MRPLKKVSIYHPVERQASIYRYAMAIALHMDVRVVKQVDHLHLANPDVTVHWKGAQVVLKGSDNGMDRVMPANSSNTELFEVMRLVAARKRGPGGKV